MKRRGILKICFLLLILIIPLFISSCSDLGGDNGEIDFEGYYQWFGDIYYYDGDMSKHKTSMSTIYNKETQDNPDMLLIPPIPIFDYYKYIYITLAQDIYLDGIGYFFEPKKGGNIMTECYYASGIDIIKEDNLSCDMFRGSYDLSSGGIDYHIYLDGHGVAKYKKTNGDEITEVEGTYTVEITENYKRATVVFEKNTYVFYFNPSNPDVFNTIVNDGRRPVYFNYTSDFDLGTEMFSSIRDFESYKFDSFFSEEYTMEMTDTSVEPAVTKILKNQTNVLLKSGNGILIRIVNNCFDAKKYDLEQVEFRFANIVIRNSRT